MNLSVLSRTHKNEKRPTFCSNIMRFMNFKSRTIREFLHEARMILEIPNAHFLLCAKRTVVKKHEVCKSRIDKRQKKNRKLPTMLNLCVFDLSCWQIRCYSKRVCMSPCSEKIVILSVNCLGNWQANCVQTCFSLFTNWWWL